MGGWAAGALAFCLRQRSLPQNGFDPIKQRIASKLFQIAYRIHLARLVQLRRPLLENQRHNL